VPDRRVNRGEGRHPTAQHRVTRTTQGSLVSQRDGRAHDNDLGTFQTEHAGDWAQVLTARLAVPVRAASEASSRFASVRCPYSLGDWHRWPGRWRWSVVREYWIVAYMEEGEERPVRDRMSEAADKTIENFEALARTADAIAETAAMSADVHDRAAGNLPGAAEHAERDRRFAAAEMAAADAYRSGEVPPDDVRQAIRDSRAGAEVQGDVG
jgi:hypothetical protein